MPGTVHHQMTTTGDRTESECGSVHHQLPATVLITCEGFSVPIPQDLLVEKSSILALELDDKNDDHLVKTLPILGFKGLAVKIFFELVQNPEILNPQQFSNIAIYIDIILLAERYKMTDCLPDSFKSCMKGKFTCQMEDVFDILQKTIKLKEFDNKSYKSLCKKAEKIVKDKLKTAEDLREAIVAYNGAEHIVHMLQTLDFK